jgi:hypothetical protein
LFFVSIFVHHPLRAQYANALAQGKQMVAGLVKAQRSKSKTKGAAKDKENLDELSFLWLTPLDGDGPEISTLIVATMHGTMSCCTNLLSSNPAAMFKVPRSHSLSLSCSCSCSVGVSSSRSTLSLACSLVRERRNWTKSADR